MYEESNPSGDPRLYSQNFTPTLRKTTMKSPLQLAQEILGCKPSKLHSGCGKHSSIDNLGWPCPRAVRIASRLDKWEAEIRADERASQDSNPDPSAVNLLRDIFENPEVRRLRHQG